MQHATHWSAPLSSIEHAWLEQAESAPILVPEVIRPPSRLERLGRVAFVALVAIVTVTMISETVYWVAWAFVP